MVFAIAMHRTPAHMTKPKPVLAGRAAKLFSISFTF